MDLHATFTRNMHGTGGNELAWKLTVFEGDTVLRDNLTYDHTITEHLPFTTQVISRLRDLGFSASANDVTRDGDGYRIDGVQRIS
ncbi:hypothetical protein [Microbacterium sp. PF5]|uniref:hypothetical protein n=1 Tax=Microbacterium sp. PF5 TaxID=2305435 RepID=UPI00109B7222|nr:hypothetical protein [Microbacterium sp. PF5]